MRTTRACNSRRNKRDYLSYSFMEQVIVITIAIVCTIALFI